MRGNARVSKKIICPSHYQLVLEVKNHAYLGTNKGRWSTDVHCTRVDNVIVYRERYLTPSPCAECSCRFENSARKIYTVRHFAYFVTMCSIFESTVRLRLFDTFAFGLFLIAMSYIIRYASAGSPISLYGNLCF